MRKGMTKGYPFLSNCSGRNTSEQFLYMMKNIPIFAETPDVWEDPYFQTMLDEAEFARMSRQQKEQYRKEMRRDWDYKNTMDYAIARGKEEGWAEGKAEGLAQGMAEGITQEQRTIARRMLSDGLPTDVIAKYTALTESQIADLKTDSDSATNPIQ